MANFRALQPAPLDEEAPPLHPHIRPLLAQKPKRTVTLGACVACRKRKSKCDGNRPICTCCSQKDTQCVYELGPNEKPSQAMKRKNDEMQEELSNLRQLYDFLRHCPEHEAWAVLHRIRANPIDISPSQRIQDLADLVRHDGPLNRQPSYPPPSPSRHDMAQSLTLPPIRLALDFPSTLDMHNLPFLGRITTSIEGPASQRRRYASDINVSACPDSQGTLLRPTSIEALLHPASQVDMDDVPVDPRLRTASNWTSVTNDADLLVSILMTWTSREHSYYHYLDRDAFLEDMANGREYFCSELLVNALLATASSTSSSVKDRSIPFSEYSIMTAFYKEATRLWDLEAGISSLTRLQAGLCLYLFLGKLGRDKAGHTFLVEACHMSQVLGLFDTEPSHTSQAPRFVPQDKWDTVRAVTAWSLFNFQLNMSSTYSFPTIIQRPPRVAIPYQHNPDVESLFRSECAKHVIILDCVNAVQNYKNSSDQASCTEQIEACYSRLMSWWHTRPASLNPERVSSKENILCAMIYHVNIINLFHPVIELGVFNRHDHPYVKRARSLTSNSLMELRGLLALQELRYRWGTAIGLVLHPITVTGVGSLDEISQSYQNPRDAERSEPYLGLLVCLRALTALASYSFYAQPLFRLLTQKCQAMELQLPDDLQNALDHYTSEEWTRNAANLVSSQYIADTRKTTTNSESARMDSVISTWEGLTLDDSTTRLN